MGEKVSKHTTLVIEAENTQGLNAKIADKESDGFMMWSMNVVPIIQDGKTSLAVIMTKTELI